MLHVKTWKSRNKFQHEGNEVNQLSLTFHLTNIFPLSSSLRMTDHCKRDGDASWRTFLKANLCVLRRNKKIRFLTSCNFAYTFYTCNNKNDTTQIRRIIYLTNRFHITVGLFSNRSQTTSKCCKNKEVAHEPQASVSLMFLPHFEVLCELLLNRPTVTWNLFVLYYDQKRK